MSCRVSNDSPASEEHLPGKAKGQQPGITALRAQQGSPRTALTPISPQ